MNERQKNFCDQYILSGGNASEAARKAGYSKKTARVIGQENLLKPAIRESIDDRLKELESERVADAQEMMELLTSIARGKITEQVVTANGKKFTTPAKIADRIRAAEDLLKIYGAFKEKLDVKVDTSQLFVETLEKIWAEDNDSGSSEKVSG